MTCCSTAWSFKDMNPFQGRCFRGVVMTKIHNFQVVFREHNMFNDIRIVFPNRFVLRAQSFEWRTRFQRQNYFQALGFQHGAKFSVCSPLVSNWSSASGCRDFAFRCFSSAGIQMLCGSEIFQVAFRKHKTFVFERHVFFQAAYLARRAENDCTV